VSTFHPTLLNRVWPSVYAHRTVAQRHECDNAGYIGSPASHSSGAILARRLLYATARRFRLRSLARLERTGREAGLGPNDAVRSIEGV